MAEADRHPLRSLFDRARRIALDVEAATTFVPTSALPKAASRAEHHQLYDAMVTAAELRTVTEKLFKDGHYARAVEEAYKAINNGVKARCRSTKDGPDLMHHAFAIDKGPMLRVNRLQTTSERDEQDGYRYLFAGAMAGFRNPRAHEHLLRDEPGAALEMLVLANHLASVLERSVRTRKRRVRMEVG